MRISLALAVLLAIACIPEKGPLMAAGQDCIECHGMGEAKRWTTAGTWVKGAHVTITDANGKSLTLRGNDVGNFYTAESLALPLSVSVDGTPMEDPVTYVGCNLCHPTPGPGIDLELMAPGRDCVGCHRAGGIASSSIFTVAGTWKGPGHVIKVVDSDSVEVVLTTNAIGNFYTSEPLRFPLTQAWVDDEDMPAEKLRGVMHGSCNVCHGNGNEDPDD